MVSASIREKLMSGTGRPIVWDGSSEPTDGYLKAIKVWGEKRGETAGCGWSAGETQGAS